MTDRVDEYGRAYAGSLLQIQTYVNLYPQELNAAIHRAIPELREVGVAFDWVSPLAKDRFLEYRDEEFLAAVGYPQLVGQLAEFWPSGGPQWNALARLVRPGDPRPSGILLIEAKSYPGEMYASGCLAAGPAKDKIGRALDAARSWYGVSAGDWMGPLYQTANRLTYVYFFREVAGVPAWFVMVRFVGDPRMPVSLDEWAPELRIAREWLGFQRDAIPYSAEVFLPARGRELHERFVPPAARRTVTNTSSERYPPGKEWRFLRDNSGGRHQFLAVANVGQSCSLRVFDAATGILIGDPRRAPGRSCQDAFSTILASATPVAGPAGVSITRIPSKDLRQMQRAVGIPDTETQGTQLEMSRSGILAGVDAFVDETLGVTDVGTTDPHYRHRTSYDRVGAARSIDGPALVSEIFQLVEANWPGTPCRSQENWRWERQLEISEANDSPEKRFEKTLARERSEWINMIPVASGVLPDIDEGGLRIDLAREFEPGCFELVELKIGPNCDTPLRAAIEILGYGIVYIFSRVHLQKLGYDPANRLLRARKVCLKVLAPAESYSRGSLQRLEAALNDGLRRLISELSVGVLHMDFYFEQFPTGVSWPPGEAMDCRASVYGPRG